MTPANKGGWFQKWLLERKARKFRKQHGDQIFLIYTMGKVGSSTLQSSFETNYPFLPAFQIHFLSDYWLKEKLPSMPEYYQVHLKWAKRFFDFRKANPKHRLKIITLMREPVMRDVSDLFENGAEYFQTDDLNKVSEEKILERLAKNDYDYTLNWFENEFNAWTGIDIYSQPFQKEKGYSIWKFPDFDILCIQLEKLDDVIKEAMTEFSGFPFELADKANSSENKSTKALYKNVVGKFRLSPEKAKAVYESKLVQHFYSEKEIEEFKKRWVK